MGVITRRNVAVSVSAARQAQLLAYQSYSFDRSGRKPTLRSRAQKVLVELVLQGTDLLYGDPVPESCDILFLHTYHAEPQRISALVRRLERRGVEVENEVLDEARAIRKRELMRPSAATQRGLWLKAAYAKYVVAANRPKVLVTLENDRVMSSFLRAEMENHGTYVNISHGVTNNVFSHCVTDFDYYFLYGDSSLRHLRQNPVRIGCTCCVLSGSPFFDENSFPRALEERRLPNEVLFFSSSTSPRKDWDHLRHSARIVAEWAGDNPSFRVRVKLHPLEDPAYVRQVFAGVPNVIVLRQDVGLDEALAGVSLVMHAWSNASIEAAVAGIPSVVVKDSDEVDEYLYLERYFPARARTPDEINKRVHEVLENYDQYRERTAAFLREHVARADSLDYIADTLTGLVHGEQPTDCVRVKGRYDGLRPYLSS